MGKPRSELISTDQPNAEHPQFVTALARGLAILRCFERGAQYLGNNEIATATGLPKPTVSRLTFTLTSLGYLTYSPSQEKYALGTAVLSLGHAFLKGNNIVTIAHPLMRELADYAQSAVMLASANNNRMIRVDICQGDDASPLKLNPGQRVPHNFTALGRADMVARTQRIFERRLAELEKEVAPDSWPRIRTSLLRARQDYARYGFCFSLGDWNPDLFAVGVPMVSADGSRIFVFNISGQISRTTREALIHDLGPRLITLRNTVYSITQGHF
jgi:DNA-binding IclR family transcriptional regulator